MNFLGKPFPDYLRQKIKVASTNRPANCLSRWNWTHFMAFWSDLHLGTPDLLSKLWMAKGETIFLLEPSLTGMRNVLFMNSALRNPGCSRWKPQQGVFLQNHHNGRYTTSKPFKRTFKTTLHNAASLLEWPGELLLYERVLGFRDFWVRHVNTARSSSARQYVKQYSNWA